METTLKESKNRTLGERFETIKFRFKLNNSQLATLAEVTSQTIGNIIDGSIDNPKTSLIKNISNKLEINMEWIVNGEGEMLKSDSNKIEKADKSEVSSNSIVQFLMQEIERYRIRENAWLNLHGGNFNTPTTEKTGVVIEMWPNGVLLPMAIGEN